MKILHIMPYSPIPPNFGGALRTFHLLKHMTRLHEVTILTYGGPDDYYAIRKAFDGCLREIHLLPYSWLEKYRRLSQFCALWTGHSFFYFVVHNKNMQQMIDWVLSTKEYDIVQTEFSLMGNFKLPTKAVKILDAHNVEYDNFRRMWLNARSLVRRLHYLREYKTFFQEEIEACNRYDAIFVTSERDKQILNVDVPKVPKVVVPNGVDTSYFTPADHAPEPYSLVFTGMMAYLPNYDGVLYFLDEIFPLIKKEIPEAKIYVVGNRPPKILRDRISDDVVVTGYVDDVRPYVWRSSVYVVPLRMGGGTRLKVLEAMSMKKPIVTTSVGCEGIDVKHGKSVLVADDPKTFALGVIELFRRADLRQRLVQNGYTLVRSRYDWSIITQNMEQYYQSLVDRKNALECNEASAEYADIMHNQKNGGISSV